MDYEEMRLKRNLAQGFIGLLGIKVVEIREGYAKCELEVTKKHQNIIGSVHGGCLYSLADTVTGIAATSYGTAMTTASGNMNYLSAAMNTEKLIGIAQEVKHGKSLCVFNVEIFDETMRLLANGSFTYFNLGKPLNL